ncbi:divergent polysaccharide deacetylase family protein [Mycoplana sp. MJR14]|uniref:divergent polysaccharide deacetylase family protein n=1 Tax=Mycoplana sp. MJR14 TaxID=3032583 RepID=UPI0023DC1704|nr:divergent polysaccharide deacetylase family protein [Mycoplana sp. MJR14]MDF1633111.1 divergent polysaccharide deacetylase family protein [Mycoplana sp. MJR14]
MGTDLNAPLGQNRKVSPGRNRAPRISAARLAAACAVVAILGGSLWSLLAPRGSFKTPDPPGQQTAQAERPSSESATAGSTSGGDPSDKPGVRRERGLSGAEIEETRNPDGSIVRTFTPKARDGAGPLILDASRVGQDPRSAAFPNDDLIEDTAFGKLPIIGPDGLRPVEQYARPWSGARGTRVAIVVGGLGLSQTGTQRAIRDLPGEITLAFAATGNSLPRWMQEARRDGHEILLQVPLEPFDDADNDPGAHTLLADAGAKKNLDELHRAMGQITNYTGIMNYMGGRFLSDADAVEPVMRDIAERGLLFLDDGSSAQSLSGTVAGALDMPHAFADIQLDGTLSREAILRKLDELERVARRNGTAIGVASAFDESIEAIAGWSEEASRRGIEIVGVAAVADNPSKQ